MNTTPQQPAQARQVRSEGLLPADEPDPSLEVAEEVAFDQQSQGARKVGAMPPDVAGAKPSDAMAEALGANQQNQDGKPAGAELAQAVERAVPDSP